MESIFDRRRDGVPEDRRTWALFLALRRHPPLLERFLTDVLALPIEAVGERAAEPWPLHYAGCQPDGEIRVGEQWLLVFEAKVRGNALTAAQVEPYLGQARKRAGTAALGLITFLHDRHVPEEVAAVAEQHGARVLAVGHQQLLGHLRAWSGEEGDSVMTLLAGDLARFLAEEADAAQPHRITAVQLSAYDLAADHVHAVDEQIDLRLEALQSALAARGMRTDYDRIGSEWMLWTTDFVEKTGITVGVTAALDGTSPNLHWWLQVDEAGCWGAAVGHLVGEALGPRANSRDDDGPWWYTVEPGAAIVDPGAFEKALPLLADRMEREVECARQLWPKLVRAAFDKAVPASLPASQRALLRRVLEREIGGEGTVRIEKDMVRVTGRGRKPNMFLACWSGAMLRGSGALTLWVAPRPPKVTFKGGKWLDEGKRGRCAAISSAAALGDALTGAEIL